MKKKLLITTSIVIGALFFAGVGAYASEFLRYEGEETLEMASDNVDEILDLIENVADDKKDAEESLAEAIERREELENKGENEGEYKDEIKRREKEIDNLEKEIKRANKASEKHGKDVGKALEKAKKSSGEERRIDRMLHAKLFLNKVIEENDVAALARHNVNEGDMHTNTDRNTLRFIEDYAQQNGGKAPSYAVVADSVEGFEYVPEVS